MTGPASYQNWKAQQRGEEATGAYEVPLYSDARITSEIRDGLGPYQLLNPVAPPRDRQARAAVYVRVDVYHVGEPGALLKSGTTVDDMYHGGWLNDEIAALLSLSVGGRFRAGPESRQFKIDGDPKGRPVGYVETRQPLLPFSERAVVPRAKSTKVLDDVRWIASLPTLSTDDAAALIKAARLYQDGLWIADAEPELTWIMFVSALETAAGTWTAHEHTALEQIEAWGLGPQLLEILRVDCKQETIAAVAEHLAPYVGSRRTFTDFVAQHCPEPPEDRPPEDGQLSWVREDFERALKKVYDYRSAALHGGKPFPAPMCEPPMKATGWDHPAERPFGLASSTKGAAWQASDTPMLLHTFEYIARTALLNWARELGTV